MTRSPKLFLGLIFLSLLFASASSYQPQCNKPSLEKITSGQQKLMLFDPPDPKQTCVLNQTCTTRTADTPMSLFPCPGGATPQNINNPIISYFEPSILLRDDSKGAFKLICPFMDSEGPLCCNDDQVEIMTNNFRSIDSVFGIDCSICAANLKRMWCDYTCHPQKTKFVAATGYFQDPADGNLTLTNFTVDPDYACTMFQSCNKVSIVAAASLQSSEAFLDFLGFNGKQQGKSIIKFLFSKDHEVSLIDNIHQCNEIVPTNGTFDQYDNCKNCSCQACDYACQAPNVNAEIGFFDGFDGELVGIVYGCLIAFSILFQLLRWYCMKRAAKHDGSDNSNNTGDIDSQEDTKDKSSTNRNNGLKKINDSQTVSNGGFSPNTRLLKEDSRDDGFKDD